MRFEIVGKNVTVTQAMREQIEKKLSSLEKYLLIDPDTMVRVVARVYPNSQKVEITVPTIDKLEDQIRRQKTRLSRRHREHLSDAFIQADIQQEEEQDIPVRTKSVTADEMALDEAIMQMELSGHSFYIYKDEDSGKIAVVYSRHSGGYGLIEVDE